MFIQRSECSTKHTNNRQNPDFSLPNRIAINEMFMCQQTRVNPPCGRRADEHHPATFQWGWHFLSCFSHQFTLTDEWFSVQSAHSSVRWCRVSISPLVQYNLNWYAFYMLCDPMWIFYEPRPVFHVHISSWASEPHTFLMHSFVDTQTLLITHSVDSQTTARKSSLKIY